MWGRSGLRRVLVVLCLTEITSWGVLYYAFPVLAPQVSGETGWSAGWVTAAFSLGQLVAAAVGVPVGRWLDRRGPRGVMTAGSVLAVPATVLIAVAGNLVWFTVGWVAAGVAMGAVLYPPAFAALTRWYGPQRVRALTALTLAAGFASTVFAPLTAFLVEHLGWRWTYVTLAGVLAVVTVPAHWWGLRGPWPERETSPQVHRSPGAIARSPAFLALVAGMGLSTLAVYAVLIGLVPLLTERGLGPGPAAVALGLGGAGQVVGRLGYGRLSRVSGVRVRTTVVLLAAAASTVALGLLTWAAALVVAAVVAGAARGVFTLVQATAVTDRWGPAHYGHLNGVLSAATTISMALAPWAGSALATLLGGYSTTFLLLAALTLLGAAVAHAADSTRGPFAPGGR